jgi:hypothetical protein
MPSHTLVSCVAVNFVTERTGDGAMLQICHALLSKDQVTLPAGLVHTAGLRILHHQWWSLPSCTFSELSLDVHLGACKHGKGGTPAQRVVCLHASLQLVFDMTPSVHTCVGFVCDRAQAQSTGQ